MPDELLQRILCVLGGGGGGHHHEAEEGGVHGVTGVTLSRVVSVVTCSQLCHVYQLCHVSHCVSGGWRVHGCMVTAWSRHRLVSGDGHRSFISWTLTLLPSSVRSHGAAPCPVYTVQTT